MSQEGWRPGRSERIALLLVIGANIVVWSVLIASAVGRSNPLQWAWVRPARAWATPGATPASTPAPLASLAPTRHARVRAPSPPPVEEYLPATSLTARPWAWPPAGLPATPAPIPTLQRASAPALPIGEHTRVVALLGLDQPKSAAIWRTDSMILVFIDQQAGRVGLLPLPRDLWVYIPGHGYGRINTVDALGERAHGPGGGLALLDQTLRENLGVPVDHTVRVDFNGFTRLIDAVGGVTVDVERPIGDTFPDPNSATGTFEMTLEAGPQHMDGQTALAYCRSRWSTSDLDRGQRQRQVLVALWEQAFTVEALAQAPHLWATFQDAFQTDLTLGQAVQLARLVQGIEAQDVRSVSLGWDEVRSWTTSQGARVLLPRTEAIQQAILELLDVPE